jgi:hypothetical protein
MLLTSAEQSLFGECCMTKAKNASRALITEIERHCVRAREQNRTNDDPGKP